MTSTLIHAPTGDGSKATLKAYSSFEPYELADYLRALAHHMPDVAIHIERMPTAALTARLAQELHAPQVDMILGWADTASRTLDLREGLFAPGADADGYMRITGFSTAIVVDTAVLSETGVDIVSWVDLAQPALLGKVAFPDPTVSGAGFLALATILQFYGEPEGWAILSDIYRNACIRPPSAWEPARLTGEGQIAAGVTVKIAASNRQRECPTLQLVEPQDAIGIESEVFAGFSTTRHRPLVTQALQWLRSEEAAALYASYNKVILGKPDSRLFVIDAENAVKNRTRWLSQLESIANGNHL
ncbi:substrate-binding domain-containing protein [Pectobacterium sp. A5351]|uniref:substrate-binding domain-containing protein n=1 Tax=Pectobacterium sp. A5351 TaxID=2914983 RepID=UPI0023308873|nr:substrate-binding domain-containing protein [Pectobacterium sp. A5351]WCG83761.1 substrate-binding domain-containing protein [Pectobacterium sp. A5351]